MKKNISNISAFCIFSEKPSQSPILSSDINNITNSNNKNNNITNNDNNKSISQWTTSHNKLSPIKFKNKSKNEMSYKDININITKRKKRKKVM